MQRRQFVTGAGTLLGAIDALAVAADDGAGALKKAIADVYAAYRERDKQRYRSLLADDYLLLENGEVLTIEGDMALLPAQDERYDRTDAFDFRLVSVTGDVAYLVYVLKSEITDGKGTRNRQWLESAIFRRTRGKWLLALLHSTRIQLAEVPMDASKLREFAARYTAAWCSQNAASVAAFFAESGSLRINDGAPAVGRAAIAAAAQAFMTAFPDMVVTMDGVAFVGAHAIYRWTLTGTNTGPGGTGKGVRISGYEEWTIGADGLIAESKGHFDEAEYRRQLGAAPAGSRIEPTVPAASIAPGRHQRSGPERQGVPLPSYRAVTHSLATSRGATRAPASTLHSNR